MIFLGWIIISVLNANACTEWMVELCAGSLCTVRHHKITIRVSSPPLMSTLMKMKTPRPGGEMDDLNVFIEGLTMTLVVGVSQSCLTLTLLNVYSHTITLTGTQFVLGLSVLFLLLFLFLFRFWWAAVSTRWGSALTFPVSGHLWKDFITFTTKSKDFVKYNYSS